MRSPMKVEVSHFLNRPGRWERRRWVVPLMVEMPLVKVAQARVDILLEGYQDGIRISGTAVADPRMRCYRCLEEWEQEAVVSFERTVRRLPDADGYCLPKDGWLLLDGIVIDEVVLSFPTAPLCVEDCRGICSGCGIHLNAEACKCREEDVQSPFSVLSNLL